MQSSVVFERVSGRLSKYETDCVERHGPGQSGPVGGRRCLECPSGRRPGDRRGASGGATSRTRATPATTAATAAPTTARRPRSTRPGHGGGDQSYPFAETTTAAKTPIASATTTFATTAI